MPTYHEISQQQRACLPGGLQPCCMPTSMGPSSSDSYPATCASGFAKLKQEVSAKTGTEYRILLLGQTGSGKTAFLNLLCNLAQVMEFGGRGPEQAVEGIREMRDYNNLEVESGEGCMTSKTGSATVYMIPGMDINGDQATYVIDTPGFGDTRGLEYDKEHARLIVEELKSVSHINCICLVVNGREARMNCTLRYVLSELTAILPRIVVSNVTVVFTNTSDALERNFDPKELAPFFGQGIPDDHVFHVENPYCKLAKARQKQGSLSAETVAKSLYKAFSEAAEMFSDMYGILRRLPPVHTKYFNEVFDVKRQIDREMLNLLAQYQGQMDHEEQIRRAQQELQAAKQAKQLYSHFETKQLVSKWTSKPTKTHNTLCGAKGCYSNCHSPCIMPKTFDKTAFKKCMAFSWNAKTVSNVGPADLSILQANMSDVRGRQQINQDSGEVIPSTFLVAHSAFSLQGVLVQKGAHVSSAAIRKSALAAADLASPSWPADLEFHEEYRDTCRVCGHGYELHYHDEVKWVQERVQENLVDEAMKANFQKASSLEQQKQLLQNDYTQKLLESQERRQILAAQLLSSIDRFQELGVNRDFIKMLHTQRELVLQHLESYESEKGERNDELRKTLTEIEKKLKLVEESSRQGAVQRALKAMRPKHWSKQADGRLLQRLDPHADEYILLVLAEMLQTDHPEWLGQGRDVRQKEAYAKLCLVDAWRIENTDVYTRYDQEKRRIKGEIDTRSIPVDNPSIRPSLRASSAKLPGDLLEGANEVRVLHGTRPANVVPIIFDGLNERFSGGLGSYFGQTLYFAEDAGKCDQYCTADSKDGTSASMDVNDAKALHELLYSSSDNHPGEVFYLFVCLHVMGKFVRTKSKQLEAPNLDNPDCSVWANDQRREFACIPGMKPAVRYHSLIAEVGEDILRYREIVQSRAERAYPEYLIAYRRSA